MAGWDSGRDGQMGKVPWPPAESESMDGVPAPPGADRERPKELASWLNSQLIL